MQGYRWCICGIIFLMCGCGIQQPEYQETHYAMGTYWEITVYGQYTEHVRQAVADAFKEVDRVEGYMSMFNPSSDVSLVNNAAGIHPVKVHRELIEVLLIAQKVASQSLGAFDVTIASWYALWKEQVPISDEIHKARAFTGYQHLSINEKEETVYLPFKEMKIDLGGIAKGYAVDRAAAVLKRHGIKIALVNGGGNLYLIGEKLGGWKIGIKDPFHTQQMCMSLRVSSEQGVATSGGYEQHRTIQDKVYCHIMDPRKGCPVEHTPEVLSVTVVAVNAVYADALSTAFFVLGPVEAKHYIDQCGALREVSFLIKDSQSKNGMRTVVFTRQ